MLFFVPSFAYVYPFNGSGNVKKLVAGKLNGGGAAAAGRENGVKAF